MHVRGLRELIPQFIFSPRRGTQGENDFPLTFWTILPNIIITNYMNATVQKVEEKYLRKVPDLKPGDTVRVHQKIKEGGKERTQIFEGVVLRVKGGGLRSSFLVRQVFANVGIEKNFPLHSPNITKIEVKKRAKVRQAYLTYLRDLRGKSARLRDKQFDALAVNQSAEIADNTRINADDQNAGNDQTQKTSDNDQKDAEVTELVPEEVGEPSGDISTNEVAKEEEKKAKKEDKAGRDETGADHQEAEAEEIEEGIEEAEEDLGKGKAKEGETAERVSEATTPEEITEEIKKDRDPE